MLFYCTCYLFKLICKFLSISANAKNSTWYQSLACENTVKGHYCCFSLDLGKRFADPTFGQVTEMATNGLKPEEKLFGAANFNSWKARLTTILDENDLDDLVFNAT